MKLKFTEFLLQHKKWETLDVLPYCRAKAQRRRRLKRHKLVVNGDSVISQKVVCGNVVVGTIRQPKVVRGDPKLKNWAEVFALRIFKKFCEVKKQYVVFQDVHDAHVATPILA